MQHKANNGSASANCGDSAAWNVATLALTQHLGGFDFYVFDHDSSSYSLSINGVASGAATHSVHDAIPEPASWALMVAGLGLVGGVLRRREGAVAA